MHDIKETRTCSTFHFVIMSNASDSHVYIVERVLKIVKENTEFWTGRIIIKEPQQSIKYLNCSATNSQLGELLENLLEDSFVLLTKVTQSPAGIRMGAASKIFERASEFNVDMGIVADFRSPNIISIPEIKDANSKKRVSVKGTIVSVSYIEHGRHFVKRRIMIEADGRTLPIVVWNTDAENWLFKEDDDVSFICMTINYFNGTCSLNSTVSSRYERNKSNEDKTEVVTITVVASNDRELYTEDGKILKCDRKFSHRLPCEIRCTVKGNLILNIENDSV